MDFKPVYIVMTKTCHFKAAFATESEAETYIKENNNHVGFKDLKLIVYPIRKE